MPMAIWRKVWRKTDDLLLSGTQVLGSGPTGIRVQIVFKGTAIKNNYKQHLRITDDRTDDGL
jgi:hypothetical protein